MLLALDIGNTHIVLGVYEQGVLQAHWRIATERNKTADQFALEVHSLLAFRGLTFAQIDAVILSNVVPPLMDRTKELSRRYLGVEPLVVGENVDAGLPIRYEPPGEVGADRLVNAIAAVARCGRPVIVVDFGTATTVDVVSADGAYLGGAIAPGIAISTQALFSQAARLPRIELALPPTAIGTNTVHAMQSGIMWGYVGLVRELVTRFRAELGVDAPVIATGGLCAVLGPETGVVDFVEPELTLRGLWLIYEQHRKGT
jgi:type III pantothenate kinase